MSLFRRIRCSWSITAFLIAACSSSAWAQTLRQPVYIDVTRRTDAGGLIQFSALSFGGTQGVSLTAPDGTVFEQSASHVLTLIEGLSASEVTSRFAGAWTINDSWNLPPGALPQLHQFTISAAQLSTFPSYPAIISPTAGATVPEIFTFSRSANSSGFEISGGPTEITYLTNDSMQVKVLFAPGEAERTIGLRATSSNYYDWVRLIHCPLIQFTDLGWC